MRISIILLAAIAVTACRAAPPDVPAPETPPSAAVPSPSSEPEASHVASLEGEWRVAGIDGADLNEPYGIALTGNSQELWWEPRCAFIVRSYRISGAAIAFAPAIGAPKPGDPPRPVCAIAPPPRMAQILRALDSATSVARTPQNGVLISGAGHSVLLFSQ